jgi:hypothetical protein
MRVVQRVAHLQNQRRPRLATSFRAFLVGTYAFIGGLQVLADDDEIPLPEVIEVDPETADEPLVESVEEQAEALDVEPPRDAESGDAGTPSVLDDVVDDGGVASPEDDQALVVDEPVPIIDDVKPRVPKEPAARVLDVQSRVLDAEPRAPVKLPPLPPLRTKEPENELSMRGAAGVYFEPALGVGALVLGGVTARRERLGAFSADARLLGTRTLHQDHRVRLMIDEPFQLPLFARATGTFFATNALPYCGPEVGYTCSSADAYNALATRGIEQNALNIAIARYHLERVIAAGGVVDVGAHVLTGIVTAEIGVGWFGEAIVDGEVGDLDGDRAPDVSPFPESLRSHEEPVGERVISHGPRATFAMRAVDDDSYPTRGFDLVLVPRATTRLLGATYDLVALAGSLEGFVPLGRDTGFVFASRTLFDVGLGDAHPLDRARFHIGDRPLGFGGIDVGRGIRLARHRGLVKVAEQAELRFERVIDSLFDLPVRVGAVAFADVGYVAADVSAARLDPALVHIGLGGGARVGLGPLVMRGDLAFSPDENFVPFPYLSVAHTF